MVFHFEKIKVVETDLQLAKMVKLYKNAVCEGRLEAVFVISPFIARLCPIISRKFGKTAAFVVHIEFVYLLVVKTF